MSHFPQSTRLILPWSSDRFPNKHHTSPYILERGHKHRKMLAILAPPSRTIHPWSQPARKKEQK